jgi:rhamnosyltransferase
MSEALHPPAVTVTFEPDPAWPERLRAILTACPRCIVVDNSLTPAARVFVEDTVRSNPGAELIANPDNPGIGRALNQAFAALHSSGHPWALTFDQDSVPPPDLATQLLATARSSPVPVAVVGANWRDAARPDRPARHPVATPAFALSFRRVPAVADLHDVLCVITSGSLFSLNAWQRLKGFDESLFLDLVDTDFCLRARRAGWRVAVSANANLTHRRGAKKSVRFLGRVFHPAFTPPFRLHCLSLNRIRLFTRHGAREPAWVAYELAYALKLSADILLLEDEKRPKIASCVQGTLHALTEYSQPYMEQPQVL